MLAVRLVKFLSPYAGVGTHEKVASSHDLAVLTLLRGSMCGRGHLMDHSHYSCGSSVCAISPILPAASTTRRVTMAEINLARYPVTVILSFAKIVRKYRAMRSRTAKVTPCVMKW